MMNVCNYLLQARNSEKRMVELRKQLEARGAVFTSHDECILPPAQPVLPDKR